MQSTQNTPPTIAATGSPRPPSSSALGGALGDHEPSQLLLALVLGAPQPKNQPDAQACPPPPQLLS
ncbi:hypothetical protein EMIHUDRAFT_217165 [Emiliania huxleyi CCMP1516]|uniref:Uncharacterized protein n=2 Tax=Emiliania huxleyi TaxID=2903 RepID=A0A0D3IC76_EMIH1|nr:hypothetical protein EMIHUDRAFT_217165 [Emiliania huxleyi CCMP1516]EOD08861.1 hypothetical protein EMIHUDRAFT_217165 [Emiliania huxleyi CCMP1516]|eukprot:XP_005761290.1 hypothetical protein EMIHUDRAFT_217165 [Emiliania huxleyi CCMP1516]